MSKTQQKITKNTVRPDNIIKFHEKKWDNKNRSIKVTACVMADLKISVLTVSKEINTSLRILQKCINCKKYLPNRNSKTEN